MDVEYIQSQCGMRKLNTYIIEKLKLTKSIQGYKYFPKNKKELLNIINQLLEERGQDADLNDIYTSNITDMSNLFENNLKIRHIKINKWDISNVKNMSHMFKNCELFDTDLSNWNVSNLENINEMFYNCRRFNGIGLDKWGNKLLKLQKANFVFYRTAKLNVNLTSWEPISKSNCEIHGIFFASNVKKPNWVK